MFFQSRNIETNDVDYNNKNDKNDNDYNNLCCICLLTIFQTPNKPEAYGRSCFVEHLKDPVTFIYDGVFYENISWLKAVKDDLQSPTYTFGHYIYFRTLNPF